MSREEEQEAFRKLQAGDESQRERIYVANMGFARQQAVRYQSMLDLEDLIQAADLALWKCIDKFDLTYGVKFISYAVWQVRAEMQKEIARDKRNRGASLDAPDGEKACWDPGKMDKEPVWISQDLQDGLDEIPELHQRVVRLYYGLDGPPNTFTDIAVAFGCSRQRIQQIHAQALRGMKEHVQHLDPNVDSAEPGETDET